MKERGFTMITVEMFNEMKKTYGQCSSWAVWNFESDSNFRFDLNEKGYFLNSKVNELNSVSNIHDIEKLGLHNNAVILALNFGKREETIREFEGINKLLEKVSFAAFHEELDIHKYSGDRRQKLGFKDSLLWGSYMTDLVKFNRSGVIEAYAESNSGNQNFNKFLTETDQIQIDGLIQELQTLGMKNPIIACVGSKCFQKMNRKKTTRKLKLTLGEDTKIIFLPHYSRSNTISDENYVKKIECQLKPFTKI